ncbi:SusC/RagA family TonB-linked outer membrane protein [Puteibacter caeruleilacunae]|nr:SusC/RagA family TonB-linked outer membrane protein [Puteibacter caeruleilacunae]
MKKFLRRGGKLPPFVNKKLFLIMRLVTILLLVSTLGVVANGYSQSAKLKLNFRGAKLLEVIKAIEEQSDFQFAYNLEAINLEKEVSLKTSNGNIDEVLKTVLENSGISYMIVDKHILLTPSKAVVASQNQKVDKVTGTVTDEDGESLPGVSVVVKGTTIGITTDLDGNYTLDLPESAEVLVFSFVGMTTQEVAINGQSNINVALTTDAIGLEEVVAIGYGTTTKRKLVSSISTVETKEIAEAPYTSVVQGLAGRSPGLFVKESGGEYGSVPSISIRGGGEPAYVIDGILASKEEFAMIPPQDIEDVSLLKDASAAAVYGFNSANGIVLVTTKRGAHEKVKISYSGNISFQQPTQLPDYLSPYELAVLKNEAAFNDGLPPVVDDAMLDTLKNNLNPVKYPNINPFDEAVNDMTPQQRHNLSLSGTINDTRVYMSLDYFTQDGIYKTSNHGIKRYSMRSDISHDFDEIGLLVNGNITLQRRVKTSPPQGTWAIWSHVRNWGSGNPMYNPEGNYFGLENPLAEADDRAGYRNEETNRVNTRLNFEWEVPWVKGLKLKALGNYRFVHGFNKTWSANQRNSAPIYTWDNTLSNMGKPSLSESTSRTYQYDLEGHVYYTRTIDEKHTLEATAVVTQSEWNNDNFSASRKDYVSPAVDQLFAGADEGKNNDGNASEGARIGYVGRLKYDYAAKYILEGSFRYDGSDNFPDGKRFGFFPAVTFGWNMSSESFIQPILERLNVNSLKFRASWGILGSTDGVGRFSYIPVYSMVNNRYYLGDGYVAGFQEGNLVSNDQSWYERESKNIGFDFAIYEGKFSGSLDWFYYRTTGYLGSPSDRYTTPLGKNLPQINTNSAHRRGGFEAEVMYHAKIGEVKLDIGANASFYDQLWERKYDEDTTSLKNPYKRLTHQKDYYTHGYIDQGLYQNMDEILNSPRRLGSTETMPGDIRYQDFNGDGRIDGDDFIRIGKSDFPHFIYGITLGATYKGFAMNALFQGAGNYQTYLGGMWRNEINHKLYSNQADSWTVDNPNSLFPRTSSFNSVNGGNNNASSSYWLIDSWYFRMKSLSVSYDLKESLLKRYGAFDQFTLLLSATNLFTISPVTDYYLDPETSSSDNYGYPVQRTYNIGVRVTF